jgi:nitronate monooxygenase
VLSTPFTRDLGIEHPLVQAGMALYAGWELASAVSNAGALGTIGTIGRTPDEVHEEIARYRAATPRPFAVNLATFAWSPEAGAVVDAALEERPPAITLSFGEPLEVLERCRAAGLYCIVQAQDSRGARAALAAGANAIIAQGTEAGGHTGRRGTLSFAAQVLDAAGAIPVLLAGGVGSGRGLAAALAMGAAGVVMGTRFKAARETIVPEWQKERIVASDGADTVYDEIVDIIDGGRWPHGVTGRVMTNRFTDEWRGRGEELEAAIAASGADAVLAAYADEQDRTLNWAGQAASLVRRIQPAGEIVSEVVAEAERLLTAVTGLVSRAGADR